MFAVGSYLESKETGLQLPEGQIGLELETQRIDRNGHLVQTPHPFEEEPYIDRDFGEAQIEINTPPAGGADEAAALLHEQLGIAQSRLAQQNELLWPFSNPPVLGSDADIRIAEYTGELEKKTIYRRYLAATYGKRTMTLCGIHFNYSFSEEVLKKSFLQSGSDNYRTFKDTLYLQLAEKVLRYSWVITALLAASPLADSSYFSSGDTSEEKTIFTGYSSLRCSREGYWNLFEPILSYEEIPSYAASVKQYREKGLLRHEGELYYPVRIKPAGKYSLRNLCEGGVNHIELRMIDLNPLTADGIDRRDLRFLQMFLHWLAAKERMPLGEEGQRSALHNLKEAARYDWNEILIRQNDGGEVPLEQAMHGVLEDMAEQFRDSGRVWKEALQHQTDKVNRPEKRYAQQVLAQYGDGYLMKGLQRAKQLQESFTEETRGVSAISCGMQ